MTLREGQEEILYFFSTKIEFPRNTCMPLSENGVYRKIYLSNTPVKFYFLFHVLSKKPARVYRQKNSLYTPLSIQQRGMRQTKIFIYPFGLHNQLYISVFVIYAGYRAHKISYIPPAPISIYTSSRFRISPAVNASIFLYTSSMQRVRASTLAHAI